MTNATQKEIVKKILLEKGGISRNTALSLYISRLSAIILDLKHEGWDFKPVRHNGNYIYLVTNSPLKKVEYYVGDKVIIKYEPKTTNT